MKTVFCTFVLFPFLLLESPLAQSDAFPLALGNRWVYEDGDGKILTRNITAVETVDGTDFFTRVDSIFSGDEVLSVDTIILFNRPENPNDVMAIADELPVDTMKIRQHQYFNNPHYGGSLEWSETYITEDSEFDSVVVDGSYAYIGTDDVPQIGIDGIFSLSLGIFRYRQDTIVEYSEELPGDYPSNAFTIFSYYPGDLTINHNLGSFNLVAYELQTTTSTNSHTLPKELKVYPNPAADEVFLDAGEVPLEIEVLGLINSFGKKVNLSRSPKPGSYRTHGFDISNFPVGMYFILVKVDSKIGALPFCKQ